jgi:hypothetical protein
MQIDTGHYSNIVSYGPDEKMVWKSAPAEIHAAVIELANELEVLLYFKSTGLAAEGVVPTIRSCGYDASVRSHMRSMYHCDLLTTVNSLHQYTVCMTLVWAQLSLPYHSGIIMCWTASCSESKRTSYVRHACMLYCLDVETAISHAQ